MIHIELMPEPANFNAEVREPGNRFLILVPNPTKKQWRVNHYWMHCRSDLYRSYHGICAYTGLWFPKLSATVDHFMPKSKYPQKAYEWNNFKLSCEKANNNKGNNEILDPFSISPDWFQLDFPSLLVKANPHLLRDEKSFIKETIDILKLNTEDFIDTRQYWLMFYIENLDFDHLERYAPFIAYELRRQNLKTRIVEMMRF